MMAQEGVSIVIPNWNHEIFLPRSISSAMRTLEILRGEGLPCEVLVIDDSSRDGSQTVLRQLESLYFKSGLRCLSFAMNGGLAASRNLALNHARYRYLLFLDADNELLPENLPLFIETLQQTQAASVYGNLLLRTPTADHAHYMHSNESFQTRLFGGGNYIDAFSVWDGAQLLDLGGYDTSWNILEDFEMWLHLATNGRRIVFVPAILGYYYVLPVSMVTDRQKLDIAEARLRRIFNQVKAREFLAVNTCHLRYHPQLGYL
jgi:glycosyltransferase involved in cell wall biosynthesis